CFTLARACWTPPNANSAFCIRPIRRRLLRKPFFVKFNQSSRGRKLSVDCSLSIPNDHEACPVKWMAMFAVPHQGERGLPQRFCFSHRAAMRAARFEVAMEIKHQFSRAGGSDLPLADHRR